MTAVSSPRPLAEDDDRNAFDCGRDALNLWFRRHAWSNHSAGMSRVSVLATRGSAATVGYVTLSAAHIERAFLPKPQQRNRPGPIPVTLLGQLAVHREHQGHGHAVSLLLFALRTALRASESIASAGVLTHPLDGYGAELLRALGLSGPALRSAPGNAGPNG